MSLNIREKLLAAFSTMLIPLMILVAMGYVHNRAIHRAASVVETISEERIKAEGLGSEMERVLMPVHDYIITGDKKYINVFREASANLDRRVAEAEEVLPGTATPHVLEEREILNDVNTAWTKIKGISSRIFAIPHPIGNREASRIMEEMDYKLAYPAIDRLKRWQEIDAEEYRKAGAAANRLRHLTWGVMVTSIFIMTAFGILFSFFYSRRFVMPIEAIRRRANEIANGSFTGRVDVKTGDELEELAHTMNRMSAQLHDLYSELRESEERYHRLFNGGNDVVLAHPITSEGKPGKCIEVATT
ncbi:MAG: HAMP domain-containing protein, partial [Deltaproteobacteria bacterium]